MFGKDLQAAVFAIHPDTPRSERDWLAYMRDAKRLVSCGARRYWTKGRLRGTGRESHTKRKEQGSNCRPMTAISKRCLNPAAGSDEPWLRRAGRCYLRSAACVA